MDVVGLSGLGRGRGDESSPPIKYQSVIAVSRFDRGALADVRLHPIEITENVRMAHRGVPRIASPPVAQRILTRLQKLSAPLGTTIESKETSDDSYTYELNAAIARRDGRSQKVRAAGPTGASGPRGPGGAMSKFTIVAATLFALLIGDGRAFAQFVSTSSIDGRVSDESGGALPGVNVSLTSPALQVTEMNTITDPEGRYRFAQLPAGVYRVRCKSWRASSRSCASGSTSASASPRRSTSY